MLCLHLIQLLLVYINTLMIQQVLAEPAWSGRLNTDDRRGITPMIHSHINPYGSFRLDLHSRTPGCHSIRRDSGRNRSEHSSFSAMSN